MSLFALAFVAPSLAAERSPHVEATHAERPADGHVEAVHADPSAHVRAVWHRPARRPPPPPPYGPPPPRRGPPPARHEPAPVTHDVAVTVNLVDVPAPLLSGGAEFALGRKVGLRVEGGLGASSSGMLYSAGGDLRGYFAGDFDRGFFLSGGAGITNRTPWSLAEEDAGTLQGSLGGKYTARFGLTIEGALGVEAFAGQDLGVVSPMAKVGVGWSF